MLVFGTLFACCGCAALAPNEQRIDRKDSDMNGTQLQQQVRALVDRGHADQVGGLGPEGLREGAGGVGQKLKGFFKGKEIAAKNAEAEKQFIAQVKSALGDKIVPVGIRATLEFNGISFTPEGQFKSVTDDRLTYRQASAMLDSAIESGEVYGNLRFGNLHEKGVSARGAAAADSAIDPEPIYEAMEFGKPGEGAVSARGAAADSPSLPPKRNASPARADKPVSDGDVAVGGQETGLARRRGIRRPAGLQISITQPQKMDIKMAVNYLRAADVTEFDAAMHRVLEDHLGDAKASLIMNKESDFYDHSKGMNSVCRYGDIKPPIHSKVSLGDDAIYSNLESGRPINANIVTIGGKEIGIATQAPKEKTANDFWQMVDENDVRVIVDLTSTKDKDVKKIPPYREEKYLEASGLGLQKGEHTEGGNIVAENITKKNPVTGQKDNIYSMNYTAWPDHGVVSVGELRNIVDYMGKLQEVAGSEKMVVHCTAGVGRTGTVMSAFALKAAHQRGELTVDNVDEKVQQFIAEGRDSRGKAFVQSAPQAQLVFQYADFLVNGGR